ncbi:metallophosphoesterase [Emticicia fluvialis]|uniref:metallophosphoesterase n=1 Tax=Emticicia fluvialis TaxID=2974474 RepID=UPI0021652D36|nr:metallophosphoesterase [Emticicia fluvialis]
MNRRRFLKNSAIAGTMIGVEPNAASARKKAFRVAYLSDVHVSPIREAEAGMARAYQSANMLTPRPDFIINGGDAILDALENTKQGTRQQFNLFSKLLKENNRLEVKHLIGNHDIWGWFNKTADLKGDNLYGKQWVVEEFRMPKRYYTFTKKGWKFIMLDSTQLYPQGGFMGQIDPEQLEWLKAELDTTPAQQHICVASHIPILSAAASLFFDKVPENGDLQQPHYLIHTDAHALVNLFRNYPNVKVCLSGHLHMQEALSYQGVSHYNNGAVSGNWWKGSFRDFEPAYAVLDFYDNGTVDRTFVKY